MFDILLSVIISFSITFLAIPVIITVAERKKLYDVPDERKIHLNPIPSLGGLGIFAGFIMASLITIPFTPEGEFQYFMAAAFVIFFLGLKDDILILSPIKKFIGQVLAAFLIIYKGGVQIDSMHGFLGLQELPEMFSLLLTYFAVIVIINSFNLIDGVDGLAGTLGLMATVVLGFYFLKVDSVPYATLAFALAGSLIAFLIFNFEPARIFMGDTGSLLIGLVNAILVIKFISIASSDDVRLPMEASPALGFSILMVPLLDTLRVFAIRIFNRRSPFSPDRNHVHHLLLDRGFSHRSVAILLAGVNILFVALAFVGRSIGCTLLIFSMVGFFFAGIAALYFTKRKPRLFVAKTTIPHSSAEAKSSSKVVPLTNDAVLEQK